VPVATAPTLSRSSASHARSPHSQANASHRATQHQKRPDARRQADAEQERHRVERARRVGDPARVRDHAGDDRESSPGDRSDREDTGDDTGHATILSDPPPADHSASPDQISSPGRRVATSNCFVTVVRRPGPAFRRPAR
jgi:hypothetical protein